jgi:hypothetical protein
VGNTTNVTSSCSTSSTPKLFNTSDSSFDRSAYDLAIYSTSSPNDPKGVGLGMGYDSTPLGVSIY